MRCGRGKLYDDARKLAVNCHSCVNAAGAICRHRRARPARRTRCTRWSAEFDERRRKIVVDGLNKLPGVSCVDAEGRVLRLPQHQAAPAGRPRRSPSALLEEAGVATIGGPDFGIHGEGYMRLSYANSTENIRKAIDRIAALLRD